MDAFVVIRFGVWHCGLARATASGAETEANEEEEEKAPILNGRRSEEPIRQTADMVREETTGGGTCMG